MKRPLTVDTPKPPPGEDVDALIEEARERARRRRRRHALAAIALAIGLGLGLYFGIGGGGGGHGPAGFGSHFPAAIYPPPVPAARPNLPQPECPNPQGIQKPAPGDGAAVVRALHQLNGKARHNQRFTDRAYWPAELRYPDHPFVVTRGANGPRIPWGVRRSIRPHGPLPKGASGPPGTACPPKVIARTWTVILGPTRGPDRRSASLPEGYYLIERRGHWLLWYVY